jgi:hypothetical protein
MTAQQMSMASCVVHIFALCNVGRCIAKTVVWDVYRPRAFCLVCFVVLIYKWYMREVCKYRVSSEEQEEGKETGGMSLEAL